MAGAPLAQSNIAPSRPSEVISHYLEAIYYIRAEGERVRSVRLADWLGVSRPTVTVALRRMIRDGMVSVRGHEIELTAAGETAAAAIVRRHRVIERWLTQTLGLDWLAADAEAARLEHAVSDDVAERIFEALGRPRTCPHGNPIPGAGDLNPDEVRLSAVAPGGAATVSRVSEVAEREAPELLAQLAEAKLFPGTPVRIVERLADGACRVEAETREVTVTGATADRVWVVR